MSMDTKQHKKMIMDTKKHENIHETRNNTKKKANWARNNTKMFMRHETTRTLYYTKQHEK
jgi:hypothetical protein